jgi:Prokaryotic N-terminal methylation motif
MALHRTRRAGLSLVEVLVALFIMALGMIALLTLFPLGALQMGQALKDDRCSQAVYAADNYMRSYWKKYVLEQPANSRDPFTQAFTNPRSNAYPSLTVTPMIQAGQGGAMPTLNNGQNGEEPSYPVFIDPRGFEGRRRNAAFAQEVFWVAGRQTANPLQARIPRRTLGVNVTPLASTPALSGLIQFGPYVDPVRTCTLLDDLTYDENASARRVDSGNNALPVERQGRYTWGWMLQLPRVAERTYANMAVVVYDARNPDFPAVDGEATYDAALTPGSTSVAFAYPAGAVPNVRAGGWVLDGSMQNNNLGPATPRFRLANFYRVTGVELDEATNTIRLDLQTPIKPLPTGTWPTVNGTYPGKLYVLKGVAEVFERRPLSSSNQPD